MLISRISATHVQVPYQAPVGPYIGRGGGPGSLGGHGLIVRVESEGGRVGWGHAVGAYQFFDQNTRADAEQASKCQAVAETLPARDRRRYCG